MMVHTRALCPANAACWNKLGQFPESCFEGLRKEEECVVLIWEGGGCTDVGPLDFLGHCRLLGGHEENRSKEKKHHSVAPRKAHGCSHGSVREMFRGKQPSELSSPHWVVQLTCWPRMRSRESTPSKNSPHRTSPDLTPQSGSTAPNLRSPQLRFRQEGDLG